MNKSLRTSILMALLAVVALSSAALFAQEETATVVPPEMPTTEASPTVVPPPDFTDGRINESTLLGGLAIYCVDANSNPVDTFENGGITVWGIGDQKYIDLSAAELHGDAFVTQEPSVMEAQMTLTPETMDMMTEEAPMSDMDMMEATDEVMSETPVLLATALTPTGTIGFFKLGNEEFALQGYDDQGNFFTYTWTGCTEGMIDHSTMPWTPELEAAATVEFPGSEETETPDMMSEMTPEMTMEAAG